MRRHRRLACCASALVALLGCRQAATPVEQDLAALLRFTDAGRETTAIDLASADAAPLLTEGWSAPAPLASGEMVVRPTARRAVVEVRVAAPAPRTLIVRAGGVGQTNDVAMNVIVRLNGRRIGSFHAEDALSDLAVALPAGAQRAGRNEIAFAARLGRGPRRGGIAYQRLRLVDASGAMPPVPRRDGDAIVLPAGAGVDYFLRLPASAALRFDLAGSGRLQVEAQADGGSARTLYDGAATGSTLALPLAGSAGDIVRLGLRATDAAGELRLLHPRVAGNADGGAKAGAGQGTPPRWNVLLYVVDTLRADHLGVYGYARPTTPWLDAFAREATTFSEMTAQSSWTRPATASIHTGCYPPVHGALTLRNGIRPAVPTLAEQLRGAGYRTGAIVTNINVAGQWGFRRGFDDYQYLPEDEHSAAVHVRADVLTDAALQWLAAGNPATPFFLYLHVTDPHAPYVPPPPFAERFARDGVATDAERSKDLLADLKRGERAPTAAELATLIDQYDGEIAFVDDQFGRLLDALRARGLDQRTLIVFVADHGEEFGEHGGLEHGRTLYQDQLRVPLLIRLPGTAAGRRVAETVRQVDVMPTILDAVGLGPPPPGTQGRSLVPLLRGESLAPAAYALAQTSLGHQQLEAVLTGHSKVIVTKALGTGASQVYDIAADPGERDDLAEGRSVLIGYARQVLAESEALPEAVAAEPVARPTVDPAVMERLRALGYGD